MAKNDDIKQDNMENPQDIDRQIADLHRKKADIHLNKQREKLTQFQCAKCKTPLLNKEGFYKGIHADGSGDETIDGILGKGNTRFKVECPKCAVLNEVSVNLKDDPACPVDVKIDYFNYAFDELPVKDLSLEQVNMGLKEEIRKMNEFKSELPRPIQLLIRYVVQE